MIKNSNQINNYWSHRFHHNCCNKEKRTHQKMKIENKNDFGDYQIFKNLLGRNPDFLRKYIKENLSKSQIDELFPEISDKEEAEENKSQIHQSFKNLIITMSDDGKGTEEMFFGRLSSCIASELGILQENVKVFSKEAKEKEIVEVAKEFQEKDINLIDHEELVFFPLRSGRNDKFYISLFIKLNWTPILRKFC